MLNTKAHAEASTSMLKKSQNEQQTENCDIPGGKYAAAAASGPSAQRYASDAVRSLVRT